MLSVLEVDRDHRLHLAVGVIRAAHKVPQTPLTLPGIVPPRASQGDRPGRFRAPLRAGAVVLRKATYAVRSLRPWYIKLLAETP